MKLFVLSGAGLSAESGLGTFRDKDGLWTRYDLSEVATPEGFAADPEKVFAFYNARRRNALEATPNAAHFALAELERAFGADLTLVTQNVDDLLERTGIRSALHMHGELLSAWCTACDLRLRWVTDLDGESRCPSCKARALRPDVVWFGEMPYHLDQLYAALETADLFVSIGTSGEVYPAAGFVEAAKAAGAETLEINLQPSSGSRLFDKRILGPATETVPGWVNSLI